MPYQDVGEVADELATHFDETDVENYVIPASRRRRYGHLIQRAYEDIWAYRPWDFKFGLVEGLTFTGGVTSLPERFANIGDGGLLWLETDSNRAPWAQIHIQDMVALRAYGKENRRRVFAVGLLAQNAADTSQMEREIWIPNESSGYGPFSLFYEMSPHQLDYNNLDNEDVPLPQIFHNTLFLGAAAKLQTAKGDPQSIWRAEYVASVAKVAAIYHIQSGQMEQLPNTVGGQW